MYLLNNTCQIKIFTLQCLWNVTRTNEETYWAFLKRLKDLVKDMAEQDMKLKKIYLDFEEGIINTFRREFQKVE
jgi:hypothetical protein